MTLHSSNPRPTLRASVRCFMDDEKVDTFIKLPLTVELRPSSPDAQVLPKTFEIRYSPFDRDQNTDLV